MEREFTTRKEQLKSLMSKLKEISWLSDDSCRVMEGQDGRKLEQTVFSTPNYSTSLAKEWISNQTVYGLLPNSPYKINLIWDKYGAETVDALSYLCRRTVSHVGYGQYKRFHSDELLDTLGRDYKAILDQAEKNGLIRLRRTETKYHSQNRPTYHNEILVVGRKGSFHRVEITTSTVRNRVARFRSQSINEGNWEALFFTYQSMTKAAVLSPDFVSFNEDLKDGIYLPNQDAFGRRIHCFIDWLPSETRRKVHIIGLPFADYCEVDLKSSHPYIFCQLICKPHIVVHAFNDEAVQQGFARILEEVYFEDEFLQELEEALESGRFYWYFIQVLNECCVDWQNVIYNKLVEDEDEDESKYEEELPLSKKAFMYLVNGGANELLHEMSEHPLYGAFARLILIYNSTAIPFDSKDIEGVKDYRPYKNIAMTLQRIESKGMQLAYVSAPIMWGFLVHDAIVCREVDKEVVMTAIEEQFLSLDLSRPILSVK